MQKTLYDQHLHSSFSSDSVRGLIIPDIVETAIERGLIGIAITDHYDPLWPNGDDPSDLDLPAYEAALTETERVYAGRIRFAKGIELGMHTGEAMDMCQKTVNAYPYDFVIGSIHYSVTEPLHYPNFYEERTLEGILDEYYTLLLDCVKLYKDYDVIGHINFVDRYTDGFAPQEMYMPYIEEILRVVIDDGKGIEINTSAFRYDIGHHGTPTQPTLNRFKELGGEIITIGSDAHNLVDIGSYIKEGEEMLLAAGFRYLAVFSERKPEFIKL